MTLAVPLSDSAISAIAEAIFAKVPVTVIESDALGGEPRQFETAAELCDYVATQRATVRGSVHVAVHYPDMAGRLVQTRYAVDPDKCNGLSYRIAAEGWGLIQVHLDLKGGRPLGSRVSANSQKRAEKWAVTYPEFDSPEILDWKAVASHVRRLSRVLKSVA